MSVKELFSLKNICKKLGEKNNPVYTVVAIAVFKGIFRPIFTMMDKKQDPESKKYAAIREGSTELIAIPTYIILPTLIEKLAPAFSPGKKPLLQILENSKTTLGFIGVCFAALIAIPGLCNIAMPHVLKLFGKKEKEPGLKPFPTETLFAVKDLPKDFKYMQVYNTYKKPISTSGGGMRV
ncbi:MAG: hypothetical protein PHC64_05170 [Candidatus Gastranaerophilales bacterium]|nr:hypothetical protein [Candidatus Gastranaerophilales bacterium]